MSVGHIPWQVDGSRHPFPAFSANAVALGGKFRVDQAVEQCGIGEPATVIVLEQVAHHAAACCDIGIDGHEPHPLVGNPDAVFRQALADVGGGFVEAMGEHFPHLLLALMIFGHGERHQLVQRHAVLGVNVVEFGRDRRQFETLADDSGRGHEMRGDVFGGATLVDHGLHGPELVERMQLFPVRVFGIAVFFRRDVIVRRLDDAGNRRGARQALLFHQMLKGTVASATGRNFEDAGLLTFGIKYRAHVEALKQRPARDILGKLGDRHAGLHAADIGL